MGLRVQEASSKLEGEGAPASACSSGPGDPV